MACLIANLLVPFQLTMIIMTYFNEESGELYRRRYLLTGVTVVAIFLIPLIVECLVWGTFPFNFDAKGIGRLRLIPFFPWPDNPYGSL